MISWLLLLACNKNLEISPEDVESIRVEPDNVVLYTSPDIPANKEFHAVAKLKTGEEIDLDLVSWESSNLSSGNIDLDGNFTSVDTNGGVTEIVAQHFGKSGKATVKVIYTDDVVVEGVDQGLISAFDSANAVEDNSLQLVYPYDGVTVPRNLDELGFLWRDSSFGATTVYRLRFQTEITDISVYTASDRWFAETDLWELISAANRQGEVGVYVTAGQWNGSSLSNPREGPSIEMVVNRLDARGSVLYWAGNTQAIMRIPFGEAQAQSFISDENLEGENNCVGCHSLANSADRLVITHNGVEEGFSIMDIEDPANPQVLIGSNDFNRASFKTLSPDGQYMLGFLREEITLYSMESGTPLVTWPQNSRVSHPDWSPDGQQIVFVRATGEVRSDMEFNGGEIVQMDIDVDSQQLSNEVVLKPRDSTYNYYYPAYSPDGDWIAYNRASNNAPRLCYSAPDAELWLLSRTGSKDIRLDNANGAGELQNSYPRWGGPLPDDDILWLAFSSRRPYKLPFPRPTEGQPEVELQPTPQIWVVAIQPAKSIQGLDPSSTPFWLPGQALDSDNHLPLWWSK